MKRIGSNIAYDYVFPKLHAIWSRAVAGDRLEALLAGHGEQSVQRVLGALGIDPERKTEVRKALTARMLADLDRILRLLEPGAAEFYALFMARFFFENLKAILRYRRETRHEVDLRFLLIEAPGLPRLNPPALLEAKTAMQFHMHLPDSSFKPALLPILAELWDTGDVFAAEVQMDRLYHGALLAAAARAPSGLAAPALRLCRREVDVLNIVMLLRNLELYHLKQEQVLALLIPVDKQPAASSAYARRLAGITDAARLAAALPSAYARILLPLAGSDLYRRENALWEYLYRGAQQAFREFVNPAASVAAFPFLKWFETLNIGRVFEGFRVGLGPADIRGMMIGLGYVQTG